MFEFGACWGDSLPFGAKFCCVLETLCKIGVVEDGGNGGVQEQASMQALAMMTMQGLDSP